MAFIYSTLAASVKICGTIIKGGAGVANSRTLETPQGVVTSVSDTKLAEIEQNEVFKSYVKDGYFTSSGREQKVEKAVGGMASDQGGSQETEKTMGNKSQAKKIRKG